MDERSIMRFTYGLACVTWVLIAMGLAWVAANADAYEPYATQLPATKAALVQPDGLSVPERPRDTALLPAPARDVHVQAGMHNTK